jgi:coatomer subunit beta
MMLKKEVVKTQNGEHEKNGEYRQMLVQAIHSCAIKFPEVATVDLLTWITKCCPS